MEEDCTTQLICIWIFPNTNKLRYIFMYIFFLHVNISIYMAHIIIIRREVWEVWIYFGFLPYGYMGGVGV